MPAGHKLYQQVDGHTHGLCAHALSRGLKRVSMVPREVWPMASLPTVFGNPRGKAELFDKLRINTGECCRLHNHPVI